MTYQTKVLELKVEIEGQKITLISEDSDKPASPLIVATAYDENGFSWDVLFECATSHIRIDEYLVAMGMGDEYDRHVANDHLGVKFAVFAPDRSYSDHGYRLVNINRQQSSGSYTFTGGTHFLPFHPFARRDPVSRKVAWGEPAPGVFTVVQGFDPHDDWKYVGMFINRLKRAAEELRQAARRDDGPDFSPTE